MPAEGIACSVLPVPVEKVIPDELGVQGDLIGEEEERRVTGDVVGL